jgi:hypothetical protein
MKELTKIQAVFILNMKELTKILTQKQEFFTLNMKTDKPIISFTKNNLYNFLIIFSISSTPNVAYGQRVHVLPFDDTIEGLTGYIL